MRRIGPLRNRLDDGNAMVEFCVLAVVLLVPLTYVLLTVFAVQRTAYAATESARDAGRAFIDASSADAGRDAAQAAVQLAATDQGIAAGELHVEVECSADPCLTPGARVDINVSANVELPLVPALLRRTLPASIPVSSNYTAVVDVLREARS